MQSFPILYGKKSKKFANIYVSGSWYLLQLIDITWYKENIQHSMLAHTDFNVIAIDNYKSKIFQKAFIIRRCIYQPFIVLGICGSNSQHLIISYHKENIVPQK